jgi:hypothetical protein
VNDAHTSESVNSELYYAEMKAARNKAEDQYFAARPQLFRTIAEISLFRAGFERAFALLWRWTYVLESDHLAEIERLRSDISALRIGDHKAIAKYTVVDSELYSHQVQEIDRLTQERDEWAAKWHRVRAELAELKYPGMKGIIRPMGSPDEPGGKQP